MKLIKRLQRFFSWEESDEDFLDEITANMADEALFNDTLRVQRWRKGKEKEPYQ